MARHIGQNKEKTTKKHSTQRAPAAAPVRPVNLFWGGGGAFQWGWQFAVRDSRLHLTENAFSLLPFSFFVPQPATRQDS